MTLHVMIHVGMDADDLLPGQLDLPARSWSRKAERPAIEMAEPIEPGLVDDHALARLTPGGTGFSAPGPLGNELGNETPMSPGVGRRGGPLRLVVAGVDGLADVPKACVAGWNPTGAPSVNSEDAFRLLASEFSWEAIGE